MTADYASPEQWLGEWPGLPADIYSLGVVLFELLTGSLPFDLANAKPNEAQRLGNAASAAGALDRG
jgi:serine/threonine protein kinase